jgi:hypothetical protein
MDRVDRHNVGVLQLGKRARFVEEVRSDLQNDQAVGQSSLSSQVDASESPRAQLGEQAKAEKITSHLGHRDYRPARLAGDGMLWTTQLVTRPRVLRTSSAVYPEGPASRVVRPSVAPAPCLIDG